MSDLLQAIIPEPQPADLLEQLAQDQQTAGLAKLTQRLISALKIPMHTGARNDQSFGGVSDLTNRGNFDQLLLSELAHDDLSLMIRLANNEALYLRREELPTKHNRQRFILIDTSIKMWGTPRIYAIATALAAISNSKTINHTFALQGSHYGELSLSSATGIKTALNQLSPALDSADALTAFTKVYPLNRQQEYFLITDEQLFYTPSFQYAFAHLRNANGFLATVSRTGQLQLFQYTGAGRRLLHSILLDLPELLRATVVYTKKPTSPNSTGLPAFFSVTPAPLYFPSHKISPDRQHLFEAFGVVAITEERRVLYWPDRYNGAREVTPCIIKGNYYFGHDGVSIIYILACSQEDNQLVLYKIDTATLITKEIECSHPFKIYHAFPIIFKNNLFLIDNGETLFSLDPSTANNHPVLEVCAPFPASGYRKLQLDTHKLKSHINNGYSTLNNVRKVYLRHQTLKIGNRDLSIINGEMFFSESELTGDGKFISARGPEIINLPNVNYKLSKFEFPNGSKVFIDSRGMVHLRPADKKEHEITIVMVLGKPTACWASDGSVCGSAYFTGNNPNIMPVREFYNRYIQSFIHALS